MSIIFAVKKSGPGKDEMHPTKKCAYRTVRITNMVVHVLQSYNHFTGLKVKLYRKPFKLFSCSYACDHAICCQPSTSNTVPVYSRNAVCLFKMKHLIV